MTTAHAFGGRTHEFGIADRLRVARESTGLDQREFAERTGLSRATISNYERGITKPKWPQIVVWSIATDFDPGWLQDGRAGSESGPGRRLTPGHVRVRTNVVTHLRKRRRVRGFRPYLSHLPQIAA